MLRPGKKNLGIFWHLSSLQQARAAVWHAAEIHRQQALRL